MVAVRAAGLNRDQSRRDACITRRVFEHMGDRRFLPQHRIRRAGDFQRAFRRRSSVADAWIVVYGYPNGLPHPRLGISASRRVGGAVIRNRWKRLLREAFRLTREQLPEGMDLIVLPRPNVEPELKSLVESLPELASRLARKMAKL
jgi:ribonuclease P protein component